MEIPEIRRLEEILIDVLGEPKNRLYGDIEGQRIFCCPRCAEENGGVPDGKFNLEICLSKYFNRGGVFQCWKCSSVDDSMKGSVFKLLKRYGTNSQYQEYVSIVKNLHKAKLYNIEDYSGISENIVVREPIVLPKTFKKINLGGYCKQDVRDYLNKRKIDQEIVDKFNIGYTEWEENDKPMSYRIIIPSYGEFGDLNFYVGRSYSDYKGVSKYKNAKVDKKEIVFQESLIDWDADILLVEGVFDALVSPNAIALLGKTLNNNFELYSKLFACAKANITICLDGDTNIAETKTIYKLLNQRNLKEKIWYINLCEDSKYKDFSEIFEKEGRKGIINVYKKRKKFSEIELI